MGRRLDISGDVLRRLRYASQPVALLAVLLFVALPLDGPASVLLAALFAALAAATAYGLWREPSGADGMSRLDDTEDITTDPFADPGQAAKDRWEKAVGRLPDGDDE